MSSIERCAAGNAVESEKVELIRGHSGHLGGGRSIESDSHKLYGFLRRKTRAGKRLGISEKSGGARRNSVVF
jgi:hypothetical protein